MQGVFLDTATVDCGDLDMSVLQAALDDWRFYPVTDPGEVGARIAQAQVVVTNKVRITAEHMQAAPRLSLICLAATGTDNVDLHAAQRRSIVVSNARAYGTPSVVQHVFALILALTTRLNDLQRALAGGAWQRSPHFCLLDFPTRELAGKVLGIVGYGELGRAVGAVGRAFGMELLVAARPGAAAAPGRVPLADLLARADVLSLHCPLTPETRGLIGAAELARMKPDALLINAARGGIVDEAALAEALRSGRLGGAGVDVLGREPPGDDNPLLAGDVPNLIVTPHVAWASRESRQRMLDQVAENIAAYRSGSPRRRVV